MPKNTLLSLVFSLAAAQAVACPTATVYKESYHGKLMANGKHYNHWAISAASPKYPLGTILRVRHNKSTLVLHVTDTMPKRDKCVALDLSRGAAKLLGIQDFAQVKITQLKRVPS